LIHSKRSIFAARFDGVSNVARKVGAVVHEPFLTVFADAAQLLFSLSIDELHNALNAGAIKVEGKVQQ